VVGVLVHMTGWQSRLVMHWGEGMGASVASMVAEAEAVTDAVAVVVVSTVSTISPSTSSSSI